MPLGLLLQNENKLDEMCNIMTELHKYVPDKPCQLNFELPDGEIYTTSDNALHPILCGGDQLTACRCRGAQSLRCSHESAVDRLEGLVPVVEDWHARLTLVKVCTHLFFCIKILMMILGYLEIVIF